MNRRRRLPAKWLRSLSLLLVLLACCALPQGALGAEAVSLHTSFSPDRLGASTTISFGFQISNTDGGLPSPLTAMSLHLSAGLNYLTTTLGLAICQPAALLDRGPSACPRNSRLGSGSAYVVVPFGPNAGNESPQIQSFMGPPQNGNLIILFYVNGLFPVFAQLVFDGELVPGQGFFNESLNLAVPLVPSVPGGPDVSIVSVRASLGPQGLLYSRRAHHKTIYFHPQGIAVPTTCHHGGFVFSGEFQFLDGTSTTATSAVPCPRKK